MILAKTIPAAMIFLRTPGGISHHPDEQVWKSDVQIALDVIVRWLFARSDGGLPTGGA